MTAPESALQLAEDATPRAQGPNAYTITLPANQSVPFVFSSPHSGRHYPDSFIEASVLDQLTLRASEDCFVEQLFSAVPSLGAPLVQAEYARAFLDVNREAWELDPKMFTDSMPDYVNVRSGRVAAGLGTIARVVASGTNIYNNPMPFAEAVHRVETVYKPFHAAVDGLVTKTQEKFGSSVLIDCHSMPSIGTSFGDMPIRSKGATADFILGDRRGQSCAPELIAAVEEILQSYNYRVVRNDPYSGGYNTRQYCDRSKNQHTLQIEINRALYVNEETLEKIEHFEVLKDQLTEMARTLMGTPAELFVASASE